MGELQLKKIIIFASYAPSLLLFRAHLIQAFLDQGCHVSVLAPTTTFSQEFTTAFTMRFPSVKIIEVDMSLHGMNPIQDFKVILDLKALFKQEQPDALFSYTIKPVIYGSIAAHCAKVPAIYVMITGLGTTFAVNSFKDKVIYCLVKKLYRYALKKCQKVIFQNPDDQALFTSLNLVSLESTLKVNGSGIDLSSFVACPLPERIQFIFIGRLVIEKGVAEFVEAAKKIYLSYPEVSFCIVGELFSGHPRSVSAELLETLKAEPCFELVGQVSDVSPYLVKSSVMVLPSYREGTPRSVLEAMAMGRPVITTDAPGCRETVIDGVNGFLVPVKNIDVLVEKMEYFIQNPDCCVTMGAESRKLAEQKFDVHQVNTAIINIILG